MTCDLTNPIFIDEAAAMAHIEADRWPGNEVSCPHCGSLNVHRMAVRPEGADHQWRRNPPGEFRMPEIGTSGSMSGDGKRGVAEWPKLSRPSSTLPTTALRLALKMKNVRRSCSKARWASVARIVNLVKPRTN
jgi:hypothetical protein